MVENDRGPHRLFHRAVGSRRQRDEAAREVHNRADQVTLPGLQDNQNAKGVVKRQGTSGLSGNKRARP